MNDTTNTTEDTTTTATLDLDRLSRARARSERQRLVLRLASRATRSERMRSLDPHETVVLAALVSRLAPVSLSDGWLSSHTGLNLAETAAALRSLVDAGVLAQGSFEAGRADFATVDLMRSLGLGHLAVPADILPDLPAPGFEPTMAVLSERCAWTRDEDEDDDDRDEDAA